jgi:PBP1b-binding outer membrane lipoprotein LpoB
MKIFLSGVLLMGAVCLFGCSSMPSGVEQERKAQEEEAADKKSEEFARSLPPAR